MVCHSVCHHSVGHHSDPALAQVLFSAVIKLSHLPALTYEEVTTKTGKKERVEKIVKHLFRGVKEDR